MRVTARLLIAIGIAGLLAAAGSASLAGDVGRNFSRCIAACNSTRQACDRQCNAECRSLFPNSPTQRGSCQSACVRTCVMNEKDCKAVCQAIKNGQSPNQPQ